MRHLDLWTLKFLAFLFAEIYRREEALAEQREVIAEQARRIKRFEELNAQLAAECDRRAK